MVVVSVCVVVMVVVVVVVAAVVVVAVVVVVVVGAVVVVVVVVAVVVVGAVVVVVVEVVEVVIVSVVLTVLKPLPKVRLVVSNLSGKLAAVVLAGPPLSLPPLRLQQMLFCRPLISQLTNLQNLGSSPPPLVDISTSELTDTLISLSPSVSLSSVVSTSFSTIPSTVRGSSVTGTWGVLLGNSGLLLLMSAMLEPLLVFTPVPIMLQLVSLYYYFNLQYFRLDV